ncbi:MAG TPA: glycosyltransferase family 4 protein [Anaerolineae bacterium]|nr:glycosyltransferase family 4 protein [Anaerolineae bacterium]
MATGYPNYFMNTRFGIDWKTLKTAWADTESMFMIGDWAHVPTIALFLTRFARNAPVALWTDTPQEQLRRPFLKRVLRANFLQWLLKRVDVIFGSGQPAKRALVGLGAPSEKIVDLQFAVDLERPEQAGQNQEVYEQAKTLRQSVGCDQNGIVFCMSGTIDLDKKAQDLGLRAFAKCYQRTVRPIGLLVAGAGPDISQLEALAKELGITESINLLGWREPEQMDAVYTAMDVLLHPAHYDPFPLVVIEAMSYAKPVIGTSTSGTVEERVKGGVNGFAVPPQDIDAMHFAMMRFIEDPILLESANLAARKTAEAWPMSRSVNIIKQALSL